VPIPVILGEFEQLVLLAVLAHSDGASAFDVKRRLDAVLPRAVSRGALYKTLERVAGKGWVSWTLDGADMPERGGYPRRRFHVTRAGIRALSDARSTLLKMWTGLEGVLS
jgi:DNA-binding PadR family transcriptional regulator